MIETRRSFIRKISIASVSLAPTSALLANAIYQTDEIECQKQLENSFNSSFEFHLIDHNLLNLHFYFINTQRRRRYLQPKDYYAPSFMVVRLPQMHITEKGFWVDAWTSKNPKDKLPSATLSGFSYLAFELWPTPSRSLSKAQIKQRQLKFNLENILDWNNSRTFDLITLVEWFDLKQVANREFLLASSLTDVKNRKTWNDGKKPSQDYYTTDEPQNIDFKKYKSMISVVLDANLTETENKKCFVPISCFEIPQGAMLVLISRDATGHLARAQKKGFWQNKQVNPQKDNLFYKKYEVWNNTIYYNTKTAQSTGDISNNFSVETPSFRIFGVIAADNEIPVQKPGDICIVNCDDDKANNVLPSLLDKAELALLTQWANDETTKFDHRTPTFDIKELNGFFFTGLGVITHLKYYNVDNKPDNTDLIEYEQIIVQARDVFEKVSRLGYNSKTGQRYKHVIEGKRRIKMPEDTDSAPLRSFVELKQYCECIDRNIDYLSEVDTWDADRFNLPTPDLVAADPLGDIIGPALTNICHYRRHPFTTVEVIEKKRIPIDCLAENILDHNNICALENAMYFWPINENLHIDNPYDIPIDQYLTCEFTGQDHEACKIQSGTPFMFIRACLIDNDDQRVLKLMHNLYFSNACTNYIERRKTYLNGKTIAYTPSVTPPAQLTILAAKVLPANAPAPNTNGVSTSKTNILETEFIETYFCTKKIAKGEGALPIAKIKNVVYPQTLRAKVFIDHIKDLTQQKIPSVLDYYPDYIENGFDGYLQDAAGNVKGNGEKLILKNTPAFAKSTEETANNTYKTITMALQAAKDKLGNLVVPDINPETISLEKLGITAPPGIRDTIKNGQAILGNVENGIQKIMAFDPRQLLRGKLSNVCGLDLSAIIDQYLPAGDSDNETPLFQLNKTLNQIEGAVLHSDIYKKITSFTLTDPFDGEKLPPDKIVEKYEKKLANLSDAIEQQRTAINAAIKKLADAIPNADQLSNLVKSLFEQYRTEVFNLALSSKAFQDVSATLQKAQKDAKDFMVKEQVLLQAEYKEKLDLFNNLFIPVAGVINNLPAELAQINATPLDQYLVNALNAAYPAIQAGIDQQIKNVFDTVTESLQLTTSGRPVFYIASSAGSTSPTTWELTDDGTKGQPLQVFNNNELSTAKYLQLDKKVSDLQTFAINNENGTQFQKDAAAAIRALMPTFNPALAAIKNLVQTFPAPDNNSAAIKTAINKWLNDAANYLTTNTGIGLVVRDAIGKVQEVMQKATPVADFLRKFDPYFYYDEQDRLSKEINDIKRRFFDGMISVFGSPTDPPPANCDPEAPFVSILAEVSCIANYYKSLTDNMAAYLKTPGNIASQAPLKTYLDTFRKQVSNRIGGIPKRALIKIKATSQYQQAQQIYDQIDAAKKIIQTNENDVQKFTQYYRSILQQYGQELSGQLDQQVNAFIDEKTSELVDSVGADNIQTIQNDINEAKNIYKLITSIKQQDLTYDWSTKGFQDLNLGFVSFKKFSDPDTQLTVAVRTTIKFTPGKFPPVIDKITTYSENRLTNFGISFFNALTVAFSEASFIAGSDQATHFDVKIKSVQFDGALSFVQAFESWLQTLGKGLILQIEPDHVALGYSLPIPSITTPAFSYFNLSLNFDLRLYFDSRPLLFGFSLATADRKFGIAAFIYAGFGFFSIVVSPKRGIVEIDCALEAGAWAGISIGPISGEVKLAFGFRYTKNDSGVRIEGYIVAEGRLSVWILEVSARIYLGIVSDNGVVEGECIVSYSVKLGFVSKTFTGTFHKTIAGSQSNNQGSQAAAVSTKMANFALNLPQPVKAAAKNTQIANHNRFFSETFPKYLTDTTAVDVGEEDETYAVSDDEWYQFINSYN